MSPRIDAHQHFWRLARGDYGWLTPALKPIYRDVEPDELAPHLARHAIDGTVLVQAAPTEAETAFMLGLAEEHGFIRGVVGWTDFAAEDAPARIAALARQPKLKGLRPMIQDIAEDGWMLRPELTDAFRAMIDNELVFDALVLPRHLDDLSRLLDRHPSLTCVIDHCAKPEIAAGRFDDWARAMARLARGTGALCKLSGLVTEAGPDWTAERLAPFVGHVLDMFGPDRVVWGSDWPVSTLAARYDQWVAATDVLLSDLAEDGRAAILGGNAVRLYRLMD